MKRRLNPEGVHRPKGTYSQLVISDGARVLHLSGQVALDEHGTLVGKGDPERQIRQIFRNIDTILRAAGASLDDVVKLTTYDTDIDRHTEATRRVRRELFGERLPASTKVQVVRLADPDYLFEVDAIAVLDDPPA